MPPTDKKLNLGQPNLVGTIHEPRGFRDRAIAGVDAVEVRADCLPWPPAPEELRALPKPAILTVRGIQEGGARDLPEEVRRDLYLELLPVAAAVDIEVLSLKALCRVVEQAKKLRRPVIGSFHDFHGVPTKAKVLRMQARALDAGASCLKIAATVEDAADLARLLDLFASLRRPCAVMGMGRVGRVSRLALWQCGSALNYGWLGKPQVPGQWSAKEMPALLQRLVC